ncbi:hypothetical protein Trydic_g11806 [Trypoxylus dichotomus]
MMLISEPHMYYISDASVACTKAILMTRSQLPYVNVKLSSDEIPYHLVFRWYGCQGILVIAQNSTGIFENLEMGMKLGDERFNIRRYLFLPTEDRLEDNLRIFNSKTAEFVADMLVVILNKTESSASEETYTFDLYTHKFVGSKENVNDAIWLDRWYSSNKTFLLNSNLYPDKLKDWQGRPCGIICFTYKPYCIIDPPDGTDMLIALEFAKRHNMTTELIVDEEGEWGQVNDNWTGSGVLGNLGQDKGDFGALYTWEHEYHFFDFSKPVMRTGITCIAPAPRLASGLATPFHSFSYEMWIMTGLSYCLASASMYVVLSVSIKEETGEKTSKTEDAIMSLSLAGRIFLLQSFQKVPHLDQSRVTFGLALILSLMLNTIYSSGLSSTMTVPRYYGTIHDADDLVAANIQWGATSNAWIESIESDTNEVFKRVVANFLLATDKELAKYEYQDLAYAVERLQGGMEKITTSFSDTKYEQILGNLAIGNYITLEGAQQRRLLDEDLYWEYCVLMLRKNSILLPSLNDLILAVTESGLVYYWEYQVLSN